jgi:hypothetical protein
MAGENGTSWWIAWTRSTPALRSARASSLPVSWSPDRIGSAKYPHRRLAAGLYISSWYSKPNSSAIRLRSWISRSNGDSSTVRPENAEKGWPRYEGSTRQLPLTPSTTASSPASPTSEGSTGHSGPRARAMPSARSRRSSRVRRAGAAATTGPAG